MLIDGLFYFKAKHRGIDPSVRIKDILCKNYFECKQ